MNVAFSLTHHIDPELTDSIIAYTDMHGDGEQDSITCTAAEIKGEYIYICTLPGIFFWA
jgi:azurin